MEEEGCCDPHGKPLGDYDERRRAGRPTVLLGFSGGQRWKLQLPEKGRILLGRGDGCDVAIKDARVSRTHCCLHVGGNVLLEDLGSTTGTRLMGRPLGWKEKALLRRGDVFEIGDTSVMCQGPAVTVSPEATGSGAGRGCRRGIT